MHQKFRDRPFWTQEMFKRMVDRTEMSSLAQSQSLCWLLLASSHNPSDNNRQFLNCSTSSQNSFWQEPTPYLFNIFFNLSTHPAKTWSNLLVCLLWGQHNRWLLKFLGKRENNYVLLQLLKRQSRTSHCHPPFLT